MDESEYVSHTNAIPGSAAPDYVKYFQDLWDCKLEDGGGVPRKLTALGGEALRLELNMTISVLHSTRVATYTFQLHPGSGERIHVLEAKVHDLKFEVATLKAELNAAQVSSLLQLKAEEKVDDSLSLCWNEAETNGFTVRGDDGVIKARRAGVYNFNVVVNSMPTRSSHQVQLLKNGESIKVIYRGSTRCQCISLVFDSVVRVEKDDELVVTCDCNVGDTSYLSAVRLWG